jgi:hypothetical protein
MYTIDIYDTLEWIGWSWLCIGKGSSISSPCIDKKILFRHKSHKPFLSWYQDVFALLISSCYDKSRTSCYHLVTRLMTVTDLLQVVPKRLMIQAVRNKVASSLLSLTCYMQTISGLLEQLVASLLASSTLLQEMITYCSRLGDNWEQAKCRHTVDNSHYRQILKLGKEMQINDHMSGRKNILKWVKLQHVWLRNVVKCGNYSLAKFANFVTFGPKMVAISARNTKVYSKVYKICKLCKAIFFEFYNISQPNFAILLILVCSF